MSKHRSGVVDASVSKQKLVSLYRLDEDGDVLVVTSSWPHTDLPAHPDGERYGIFISRQIDDLREQGFRFHVLFIRGFASKRAYVQAAALLMWTRLRRRRYRLVHAHGGEAGLAALFACGVRFLSPTAATTYWAHPTPKALRRGKDACGAQSFVKPRALPVARLRSRNRWSTHFRRSSAGGIA